VHGCYRPLFLFIQDGEFSWDLKDQGLVFGSFFWGYIAMHLPGGLLAERFGGSLISFVELLVFPMGTSGRAFIVYYFCQFRIDFRNVGVDASFGVAL